MLSTRHGQTAAASVEGPAFKRGDELASDTAAARSFGSYQRGDVCGRLIGVQGWECGPGSSADDRVGIIDGDEDDAAAFLDCVNPGGDRCGTRLVSELAEKLRQRLCVSRSRLPDRRHHCSSE